MLAIGTGIGAYRIWAGQPQQPNTPLRRHLVCGCAGLLGRQPSAALGARSALPRTPVLAVVGARSFPAATADVPVAVLEPQAGNDADLHGTRATSTT